MKQTAMGVLSSVLVAETHENVKARLPVLFAVSIACD
jgi:hypothetical protein